MRIAIIGYGKMGKAIANMIRPADKVVLKIGSQNTAEFTLENLQTCDVAIDFSTPQTALVNIKTCLQADIPVISGTTGWQDHINEIHNLVEERNGAFFYASNFSVGVNLFFAINAYSAKLLAKFPDYAVDMEEQHHIHKVDAPSGTAIRLSQDIISAQPKIDSWSLEKGAPDAVFINAVREGEIPGTHIVQYTSGEDKINLAHQAFTRDSFARGALGAARWIIGKKGIFGMKDLLAL